MYQPSTRMYIHSPSLNLYQTSTPVGHACHANLVHFRSKEINHQRMHVSAVVCTCRSSLGNAPTSFDLFAMLTPLASPASLCFIGSTASVSFCASVDCYGLKASSYDGRWTSSWTARDASSPPFSGLSEARPLREAKYQFFCK